MFYKKMPLSEVLRRIGQKYPGHMLEARLETFSGVSAYFVLWAMSNGRRLAIWADADTGTILDVQVAAGAYPLIPSETIPYDALSATLNGKLAEIRRKINQLERLMMRQHF